MANRVKKPGFETFEHGADIGVRGIGKDLEEAFSNAAKAMFSIMVTDFQSIKAEEEIAVECSSFDLTGLLVAYLNQLLAEADIAGLILCHFNPHIDRKNFSIQDKPQGQRWPKDKEALGIEVKGATFTLAEVRQHNGLYVAQCVVDV